MRYLMKAFTFIILLLAATSLSAQTSNSVEGDYRALMDMYEATNGDNWNDNTGWGGDPSTMGSWTGIETNADGRVVRVDMLRVSGIGKGSGGTIYTGNNLTGTLPESIGNLKRCTYFNVKQNNLFGSIPDGIGLMEDLEYLHLGGQRYDPDLSNSSWNGNNHTGGLSLTHTKKFQETNEFSGLIPESIGNLSNLISLEIRRQHLTGSLPTSIGGLTNLVGLFLNDQKGDEPLGGRIPDSFGDLVNLKHLHLNNNTFSGIFPSTITTLKELRFIRLDRNNFSGAIPKFTEAYDIRFFYVGVNEFTGEFPIWLFDQGKNPILNAFSISQNNLTGSIPNIKPAPKHPHKSNMGFDNYHSMTIFDVSYNDFEGEIPDWIVQMSGHIQLKIHNTNLSGALRPEFISGINENGTEYWGNRLRLFEFENNNLSGDLPDAEWRSINLLYLKLQSNNFTGSIPKTWESLKNSERLSMFRLENNELSGEIPKWVGELERLNWLGLENNRFTFVDILPNFELIKSKVDDFRYFPQKPFGYDLERTMPSGEDLVLDLSEYHYDGNEYQWVKDDRPLSGAQTPVLILTNLSSSDEGEYRLEVKNAALPELGTHSSQAITFRIGVDDGKNEGSGDSDSGGRDDDGEGDDGDKDGGDSDGSDDNDGPAAFPGAPVQYSPANQEASVSLKPEFSWSDTGADYYILHSDRNNPSGMVINVTVKDTTYSPSEIKGDDAVHYWRVRGVKDGEMGEWSSVWSFRTKDAGHPEMVTYISPEHRENNVSTNPVFEWSEVESDRFVIRLRERESSEWIFSETSESSRFESTEKLEVNTEYIWQVKNVLDGIEGAWSPMWGFSTGEYEILVEVPSLVAPDHQSEYGSLSPTFVWEDVDADHYVITVMNAEQSNAKMLSSMSDENIVIVKEVEESSYTAETALESGEVYYWRVKAVRDGEEGEWSELWEFIIPNEIHVSNEPDESPMTPKLKQNYPNPFNPSTQIAFILADVEEVSLRVYDMAGRQVAELVNGVMQAGRHEITFRADNLASGVYFYRFITDTRVFTKKMTLVK